MRRYDDTFNLDHLQLGEFTITSRGPNGIETATFPADFSDDLAFIVWFLIQISSCRFSIRKKIFDSLLGVIKIPLSSLLTNFPPYRIRDVCLGCVLSSAVEKKTINLVESLWILFGIVILNISTYCECDGWPSLPTGSRFIDWFNYFSFYLLYFKKKKAGKKYMHAFLYGNLDIAKDLENNISGNIIWNSL